MNNTAVIVAGGSGKRMKSDIPKQFLPVCGKPVIARTIEKFEKNPSITDIVVVCNGPYIGMLRKIVEECEIKKVSGISEGGKTRQESVYRGLKSCPRDTDMVIIHDAVRPFISGSMIEMVIAAAKETGASSTVVDMVDSVFSEQDGLVGGIVDRSVLKRVQTPQGFRYGIILEAHEQALKKGISGATDDCGLVFLMNKPVRLVPGSEDNIKITTKKDMILAETILKGSSYRAEEDG